MRLSKFNIVSIVTDTLMGKIDCMPILSIKVPFKKINGATHKNGAIVRVNKALSETSVFQFCVTTDTFMFAVGETTYCGEVETIRQREGSGGEQRCGGNSCGKTAQIREVHIVIRLIFGSW